MREEVIELAPSEYKREGQEQISKLNQLVAILLRPIVFVNAGGPAIWLVHCIYFSSVFIIYLYLSKMFSRLVPPSLSLHVAYQEVSSFYLYIPKVLALALVSPLVITLSSLSVRIIWRHARFNTKEFLQCFIPSVQLTTRTIFLVLSQIFLNLIPVMATLVISYLCGRKAELAALALSLKAISLLLLIVLLYKSIPLLLAPLVSVCAQMRSEQAIPLSLNIFKSKNLQILPTLAVITVCALAEIIGLLPIQIAAGIGLIYCLTSLSLLVAESVGIFEQRSLQTRKQNTQTAPGPVIINVQNLWLSKKQ